jgi:hypothetical protein
MSQSLTALETKRSDVNSLWVWAIFARFHQRRRAPLRKTELSLRQTR